MRKTNKKSVYDVGDELHPEAYLDGLGIHRTGIKRQTNHPRSIFQGSTNKLKCLFDLCRSLHDLKRVCVGRHAFQGIQKAWNITWSRPV